jgi:hypothetical protein
MENCQCCHVKKVTSKKWKTIGVICDKEAVKIDLFHIYFGHSAVSATYARHDFLYYL